MRKGMLLGSKYKLLLNITKAELIEEICCFFKAIIKIMSCRIVVIEKAIV